jgi:hypothetical protein
VIATVRLVRGIAIRLLREIRQYQKKVAKDAIQNISEQDILMQIENFYQANKHFIERRCNDKP